MPKIYLVFSNIGKTYFCKTTPNWIDLDWYIYSQVSKPNPNTFLINVVNFYKYYGYNILISHSVEALALIKNGIKIDAVILPRPNMKEELLTRCKKRAEELSNLDDPFINNFSSFFDIQYYDMMKLNLPKIFVKPGQYLTDIIDADGNLKPGIVKEGDLN